MTATGVHAINEALDSHGQDKYSPELRALLAALRSWRTVYRAGAQAHSCNWASLALAVETTYERIVEDGRD